MKHKHHIKPRYEKGSNEPENLVELTPTQHAMWHYAEWLRKGNWQDLAAYRTLAGRAPKEEVIRGLVSESNRSRKGEKRSPRPLEVRLKIAKSVKESHERARKEVKPKPKPPARGRGRKPKPIELTSPCGQFAFLFPSAKEAGAILGLWDGNITKVARGEWKQTGGWTARYV
jgi:hypothetical protein